MGDPAIQILGVYRVEPSDALFQQAMEVKHGSLELSESDRRQAEEIVRGELSSVVLIEVSVENRDDRFDVSDFAQPGTDQTAYDEAFLSPDGNSVLSRLRAPEGESMRLTFFLHFFDPESPLMTSYGQLSVPPVREMPGRLQTLVPYEPVD